MTETATTTSGVLASLRATPAPVRYLLGGILVNQLGTFIQTFLLLYLTQAHRFSFVEAGMVLTAYSVGSIPGSIFGGELTHRFTPRTTIAMVMSASAVLVGLVPWATGLGQLWPLMAVTALAGLAAQAYRPAASVLLSELMPEPHRVMAFSMMRIALNAGAAVGPLLAAVLILVDWNLLFWVDAATALLYAATALLFLPSPALPARNQTDEQPPVMAMSTAYAILMRDRPFLLYLASMLLSAAVYMQYTVALPLKIAADGHPMALYSAALATSSIILVSSELAVTARVRHWSPQVAAALGTAMFSLGLTGYGLPGRSPVLVIVCIVVFVTGLMISGPTMWAWPTRAGQPVRARYIGASQAAFGIGAAAGPVLGVWVWSSVGNGVWALCGLVGLIAAGCALFGMRAPGAAAARNAR